MNGFDIVLLVTLVGLGVAGALIMFRLVQGPTNADRIVALDTLLLVVVAGTAVEIARRGADRFTPVLVAVALLAFIGTITVARFFERSDPALTDHDDNASGLEDGR